MGFKFDSKWEAERYGQLVSMEMARVVQDLRRQVTYDIMVNEQRICKYIADFVYTLIHEDGKKRKLLRTQKGCKLLILLLKKINESCF